MSIFNSYTREKSLKYVLLVLFNIPMFYNAILTWYAVYIFRVVILTRVEINVHIQKVG